MMSRRLRKLVREPLWYVLALALVVGIVFGKVLAHEQTSDAARIVFGRAWRGDAADTRAMLLGLLGFQATVVTVILSLNAMVIKSAAYQYSPRLIMLYIRNAPMRRALPMFVLIAGYILGAVRELGLVADDVVRPRGVVSGAAAILVVALVILTIDLVRTFRFIRVERVLGLVRDATYDAAKRISARVERMPLDRSARLDLPLDASGATAARRGGATALLAEQSGYLVDVDLRNLVRRAESAGVRVRVCQAIGDYVDEGQVIGWAASDARRPIETSVLTDLVDTVEVNPIREPDYDPALGIRIITDVANRALSSSANDPYTARQALNQLRSVLAHVGKLPLGDWQVVDPDGSVRVSVKAVHLRDLMSIAVSGPLHYGADDPDVVEGLLEIVLMAGWVAREPEDRAAARRLLDRLEGLARESTLEPERLERLKAEAEPVRRLLSAGAPLHPPS